MTRTARLFLRKLLRIYVRKVPLEKGKGRLLNWLGPIAADSHQFVPFSYDGDIHVELDLTELIQNRIYYYGCYEEMTTAYLCQSFRPGMDFVDVGANIGYYTLMAARRLSSDDRVHAFEPDKRNFERLRRHVALNGFNNVVVNQLAVSNVTGTATFYSSPVEGNWGMGSLRPTKSTIQTDGACHTVRLDDYFALQHPSRIDKVGLIKMDIEGAELLALQGAAELLRHHPVLVLEAVDWVAQRFGYSTSDLVQWLRASGYRCHRLTSHGLEDLDVVEKPMNDEIVCLPA